MVANERIYNQYDCLEAQEQEVQVPPTLDPQALTASTAAAVVQCSN